MRILVNNVAASSGGALSILKSFYQYLIESDTGKEHEWIFLLSSNHIEERENIKVILLNDVKSNWLNRLKFDFFTGKSFIKALNPDIVFSMQNTVTFGVKCPQILYMHQSIPFQRTKKFSFFKSEERILAIYQHIIGRIISVSIKRADKVVVQTKWIHDAIIEFTNVSPEKVITILPPINDYSKYKKDDLFKGNNFFYPASEIVYKNHQCIYDACVMLKEKGITNFEILLTTEKEISNCNIVHLGKLSFEEVMEKYNTSTLIFPSYIETVGLPLIEAKQVGALIFASDCSFSREILNDYENAYFFDPFKPSQLACLMEKVITGKILRNSVKNESYVESNSWEDVLNLILNEKGN